MTDTHTPRSGDRRGTDRRKVVAPNLPFADRRQGERRSGADRRAHPRDEA